MSTLLPPDSHHFSAAIGWAELGNPVEALVELNKISAEHRNDAAVLEVEWVLCAEQKNWEAGLGIARKMIEFSPQAASGWLHQAYALRRVNGGGTEAAWDALLPAYGKFPQEPTIAYNLACYACQLGKTDESRDWLLRALKLLGKGKLKEMALSDPDLKPLWGEICDL